MTDLTEKSITEALDAMKATAPGKRIAIKPAKPEIGDDVLAVLAVCWQALMEVPSERGLAERYGYTLSKFIRDFHDSLIVPILVGDKRRIIGAMWFKDGEVHLAILREFRRGAWVRRLPELFAPGFKAYSGKLFARVNKKNLVARRFTERIGGKKLGEDSLTIQYVLLKDRMKYWTRHESLAQDKSDGLASSS